MLFKHLGHFRFNARPQWLMLKLLAPMCIFNPKAFTPMAMTSGHPNNIAFCSKTVECISCTRLLETIICYFFDQNVIFYFTISWKPSANNEIWWIIKVLTTLKTFSHFCWNFIHFYLFISDFYKFRFVANEGAIHISNYWLCLKIDYVVWFVSESDK